MSLLERVGLAPKAGRRPRRSGIRFEGRGPAGPPPLSRSAMAQRLALLAVLVALAVAAFPNVERYDAGVVGEVWRGDDVLAPFDFPLRIPEAELAAQRDSIRRSEPPVFVERADALDATLTRLDTLRDRLSAALDAYVAWQAAEARGQGAVAEADSARFAAARAAFPAEVSDEQWALLTASFAAADGGAPAPTRDGGALGVRVLREVARVSRELLARGVLDVPADSLRGPQVAVQSADRRVREERLVPRTAVRALDGAMAAARTSFDAAFPNTPEAAAIAQAFLRSVFTPSLRYQQPATERRLAERLEEVRPTRGLVKQGYTIVRRGDVVTPEIHAALSSLAAAQRDRSGDRAVVETLVGQVLLCLAAYALFFLYLYLLRRQIFDDFSALALIALLFAFVAVGVGLAARSDAVQELVIPVALISILLTVLFDSRVGMFGTVSLATLGGLIGGFDFAYVFATLFAGLVAVFSVRDVKNRSQLLVSAGLVLGAYLVVLVGFALMRAEPVGDRLVSEAISVAANAGLLLLAAPILYGIERVFGYTTDLTLLELSDTNRPLLKELSLRAPGTFNHALQVANLAEAAADAIGANALRARVGALYHDVGKMLKPEYFVENQQPGENPHDRITPYMSALIIAAHVKDGVEIARTHRLPRVIVDFIPTHHGTGLMEFFYRKAVEQNPPEEQPVDEAEFRYPGPRPSTAEQAIVMLADSVEAASRSLQKPTPRRLEALIDALFRQRLDDGQLALSPLTLADLTRIRETFLSILCGIYHYRVKYPGQDGEPEEPEEVLPDQLVEPRPGLDVALPPPPVHGGTGDGLPDAARPEDRPLPPRSEESAEG